MPKGFNIWLSDIERAPAKPQLNERYPRPLAYKLMTLSVGERFAGKWRGRNGVYATAAELKRRGILPRSFTITITRGEFPGDPEPVWWVERTDLPLIGRAKRIYPNLDELEKLEDDDEDTEPA